MDKYRIIYNNFNYEVQEKIHVGWFVFKRSFWITVASYWEFKDAFNHKKTMDNL